jgi:putative ABC transport system ATP-binding protein
MILLEEVTKTFKTSDTSFTALRNVSLHIEAGEHIAVMGKSGSGKSTLLNILTGIDYPTQGTVMLNNQAITKLSESRLAQWRGKNIGIVFQFFQLIPTLTVLENLLLAMEFVNVIPKSERRSRAQGLLAQVGIAEQAFKLPAALSGGQQQRVAIARALANDPPIVVADEPTGNLDSKTADSIREIFRGLSNAGKTVVVVTHEKETASLYDRTIVLADGEIVSEPKPATSL